MSFSLSSILSVLLLVFSAPQERAAQAYLAQESPVQKQLTAESQPAALGPEIGSQLPKNIATALTPTMGQSGTVVFFIRSVAWCPYCQSQVLEVSTSAEAFSSRGYKIVYISYDSAEEQQEFQTAHGVKGTFLSDPTSDLIRQAGLLDETMEQGSRFYGIPHPAILIISPEYTVQDKLYQEDWATNKRSYQSRPALSVILEALDGLSI